MALELQPFMSMLENFRREHQRRQEAEPRPSRRLPRWAENLDPADFKGKTREMLLEAQAAAPGRGHPGMIGNAGGDRGMATASHLGDVGRNPSSTGLVDSVRDLIGGNGAGPVQQARGRNGLSSEELANLVPFDTRPAQTPISPDTRQRLSPAAPERRLQPVPTHQRQRYSPDTEDMMGREAADVKARRHQVARAESVHPHPGREPNEQPRQFNMRKELGPHVGSQGSYVDMQRRYRQTGELPGMNGMTAAQGQARQQATSAFRGATPTSDTAPAGRPQTSAVQPASHTSGGQRRGTGLFSGSGIGVGDVLGGIGAMLRSAGGDRNAVDQFVKQRAEQRLTNQTRQAAIDLGIDPEFARTAPIPVLTPLLGEAYKQKHAGPEYGFMNVDGTVIRTDKRGGTVSPVYQGAGGQTIPGTQIGFDTDIGRKYSAFVGQGFSHDQALGVASGRYDLKVTDVGTPVMIDTLTNREVPIQRLGPAEIGERQQLGPTPGQQQGQPQQAGQTDALGLDPDRDRTLYEMADSGTGLWNIMGDFFGRVGPQFVPGDKPFFPDQREAVTTIRTANRGLVRALQQSPRYAEGERRSIEQEIALNPSIGMSPEAWRQSAVSVDRLLRTWWAEDMQDAQSGTLAAEDRQRALASARAIERYLQILGVPQEGEGAGQMQQGQPAGQPVSQGGAVTVGSPAEADQLPPGTIYRTPDGRTFRR